MRTLCHDLSASTPGTEVLLEGWVHRRRELSRVTFLVRRDRSGLATDTIAELLDWGASRGARTAWLHVESDNEAGLALYDRLGFRAHHLNRYLVAR